MVLNMGWYYHMSKDVDGYQRSIKANAVYKTIFPFKFQNEA